MATRRKPNAAVADVRDVPLYTVAEGAQYLCVPRTTLAHWVQPRGLIRPAAAGPVALSFLNLVEAFVLSAIRRKHQVPMQRARRALSYVQTHLGLERPLVNLQFQTDGLDLFVERYGAFVNASQGGQHSWGSSHASIFVTTGG